MRCGSYSNGPLLYAIGRLLRRFSAIVQIASKVTPVPGNLLCLGVLRNEVQRMVVGDVVAPVAVLAGNVSCIGLHWEDFGHCCACPTFSGC